MAAERHGLTQRCDKDFAIWTGAQVAANLLTNVGGEFVVDIGGQPAKDAEASVFSVSLSLWSR